MSDTNSAGETQALPIIARCIRAAADTGWDGRVINSNGLASAILAELAAAGYRVVPVEPTPAMWASVNLVGRAHVSKLCSVEGWRAMLDAARVAE